MILVIEIPGEIRGKGRPRFTSAGQHGRAYTDARTVSAENWVKACAVDAGATVAEGPLFVTVEVGVKVPRSWTKKRQAQALTGALFPTGKPDLDNIIKLISDALNGIAWRDDSQITTVQASKRYSAMPGALVMVRPA